MMTREIIDGAYLAGFEPSTDNLTTDELLAEAEEFLTQNLINS
jgi:hypothetical protein